MPGLTLTQFLDLQETKPASEYACGEAYQKPMPDFAHSAIQAVLTASLFAFLTRSGLGRILPEFRCIFGPLGRERTYVPDLVYVAKDRLPTQRHLHAAPDLAIEILSPDQPWSLFLDKIQFYLIYGVRLIWVIDPASATITIQMPGREAKILRSGDHLDGGAVLPGYSIAVDEIFAQTNP